MVGPTHSRLGKDGDIVWICNSCHWSEVEADRAADKFEQEAKGDIR